MTNNELIEKIASAKLIDKKLDILYDEIDKRFSASEYDETDKLFYLVADWDDNLMVGLLCITHSAKNRLSNRKEYLESCKIAYQDTPQLFQGLE